MAEIQKIENLNIECKEPEIESSWELAFYSFFITPFLNFYKLLEIS